MKDLQRFFLNHSLRLFMLAFLAFALCVSVNRFTQFGPDFSQQPYCFKSYIANASISKLSMPKMFKKKYCAMTFVQIIWVHVHLLYDGQSYFSHAENPEIFFWQPYVFPALYVQI